MHRPSLALIAAVDRQGGIGHDGQLLWHESADQKRFRQITLGCPVIMGRKTWDSLPAHFRPLPGRHNIVLTRDAAWRADGASVATSLDEALALACREAAPARAFVIGGAEVYAQALPQADELVLTEIDAVFAADAFFPAWDPDAFSVTDVSETYVGADGSHYRFVTYQRRPAPR